MLPHAHTAHSYGNPFLGYLAKLSPSVIRSAPTPHFSWQKSGAERDHYYQAKARKPCERLFRRSRPKAAVERARPPVRVMRAAKTMEEVWVLQFCLLISVPKVAELS